MSKAPVGEQIEALDPKDWDGVWVALSKDDALAVRLRVSDADRAVIRAAYSLGQEGEITTETGFLHLRRSNSLPHYWLISAKPSEFGGRSTDEGYGWVIASREEGARQLIFWLPNARAFRDLVRGGTLHGEVAEGKYSVSVHLDELTAADLELIASRDAVLSVDRDPGPALFNWENPRVLTRQ